MKARGLEFHAISSPGDHLDEFAVKEGALAHRVEISRTITPLGDLLSVVRLWWELRKIRPAIVQAHTTKAGLLGMIAAWLARCPIRIYYNHGIALLSARGFTRFMLRWCDRLSSSLADRVIYVAPSVRDAALAEGLCPVGKTKAILSINGLDAAKRFNPSNLGESSRLQMRQKFGIPASALVVGFVGRIFMVKGIVELVAGWNALSMEFDSLHLLVVGSFDSRVAVPKGVERQLRSDARIHLTGYVEDMPLLYRAMDLLVLPSHHEGLGYVLIEASAMELPVVGTRIPGIVEAVLDGETGILVEPGDPCDLANAIRRYLRDPELRKKHGRRGREYVVKAFQRERVWQELYQEYVDLLRTRGKDRPGR